MDKIETTRLIKEAAVELGFAACGISRAEKLDIEARRLEKWLQRKGHGQMYYMADQSDVRIDPGRLLPGAQSVISLAHNYYQPGRETAGYRIARYAQGKDYHRIITRKLQKLAETVRSAASDVQMRCAVDSGPIMEKAWAARSGLGWIGKNGLVINPCSGSFHFLAELILDIELEFDQPISDHCGTCRRCIDTCPTKAIVEPYVIDASRCISYLTIESKGDLPEDMAGTYSDWIFGCDICQEACPFNRFAQPTDEPAFQPRPDLFHMTVDDWRHLTPRKFEELFQGTPVKRAGYEGLMRNIRFLNYRM
jgi:epoxyqueuosine reductase